MDDIGKWFDSMIVQPGEIQVETETETETETEPEPKPRPKAKANPKPLALTKTERAWIQKIGENGPAYCVLAHVFGKHVYRTDGKTLVQVPENVFGKIDKKDLCEPKKCVVCKMTKGWEFSPGFLYDPNGPSATVEKGIFKKALTGVAAIIKEDYQKPISLRINAKKNTVVLSGKNYQGESGKMEIAGANVNRLTIGGRFPVPMLMRICAGHGKDTITIFKSTTHKMAWAFVTDKMTVIVMQVKKSKKQKPRKESY